MRSREFNCLQKIVTVCNNRGFGQLGSEILKLFGPKYLKKDELNFIANYTPANIKYANKTSFIEKIQFGKNCTKCAKVVEKNEPAFIQGKDLYHVLCGLETLENAKNNIYYNRWILKINEEKKE